MATVGKCSCGTQERPACGNEEPVPAQRPGGPAPAPTAYAVCTAGAQEARCKAEGGASGGPRAAVLPGKSDGRMRAGKLRALPRASWTQALD